MKKLFLVSLMMVAALAVKAQGMDDWRENDLAQRYQLLKMGDLSAAFWSTTSTWHDGKYCYFMEPLNAAATKISLTKMEIPGFKEKSTWTIKRKGDRATCKGKEVTHETLGSWDMLVFRDGKGNIKDVLIRTLNSQDAAAQAVAHEDVVANEGYPTIDGRFGFASVRPLTRGILERFSQQDLRIMQWEMYARHGAPIPDPRYWDYFDSQPWYQKRQADKVLLSDVEHFNFSLIKAVEAEK